MTDRSNEPSVAVPQADYEVPFSTDSRAEPGIPFPMLSYKTVEHVMCRDCPFPMNVEWPADFQKIFDDWQQQVLGTLQKPTLPIINNPGAGPYAELIGKRLEVVRPGSGAQMIYDQNRIVISIDDQNKITHISAGANIHPVG